MNDLILRETIESWPELKTQCRQHLLADHVDEHNMALAEFMDWFRIAAAGFTKSSVRRLPPFCCLAWAAKSILEIETGCPRKDRIIGSKDLPKWILTQSFAEASLATEHFCLFVM